MDKKMLLTSWFNGSFKMNKSLVVKMTGGLLGSNGDTISFIKFDELSHKESSQINKELKTLGLPFARLNSNVVGDYAYEVQLILLKTNFTIYRGKPFCPIPQAMFNLLDKLEEIEGKQRDTEFSLKPK